MAGGKPFKATPALRRKVEELISCGMSQENVARAIGCTKPTLEKHFREELDTGAARKRAEVIAMLYKAARGGNVTAQKKLEEMSRAAVFDAEMSAPEPKRSRKGKKEAAREAAQKAGQGSEWGDDLAFDGGNVVQMPPR